MAFSNATARWLPLVLVVLGALLYANTLDAPFIFDDEPNIKKSEVVQDLGKAMDMVVPMIFSLKPPDPRPLVTITLALNYAVGGFAPQGYHVVNIVVHILAGLALFGLVRRTMLLPRWQGRFETSAHWWALAVAAVWLAHPLNTQAVTYTIQRAESMMAMFFLASMYAAVRQATATGSAGKWGWGIACILAAMAGTWCKQVIVGLPLVVIAFDWVMLQPRPLGQWLRQRGLLYVGLFAVSGLLAIRSMGMATEAGSSAGFGMPVVGPFGYLISEPRVILHYLRLAFWPDVLVLDYFWLPAIPNDTPPQYVWTLVRYFVLVQSLIIGSLGIASLVGLYWRQWWAFCGVAFFVILAPTSSVMPIADLAVEHRMYLPLTCVVAVVVISVGLLLRWIAPAKSAKIGAALLILATAALGTRTVIRNYDYLSPLHLWDQIVIDRPGNPRAWQNLGALLLADGQEDNALLCFEHVLDILPNYAAAHAGLGDIYLRRRDPAQAIAHYQKAAEIESSRASFHYDLGRALLVVGQLDQSYQELSKAIELQPDYAKAHNNLGLVCLQLGKLDEAIANLELSIAQDPDQPEAYVNLATAYEHRGDLDKAVEMIRKAIDAAQRAYAHPDEEEPLDAQQQADRMQKLKLRLQALSEKAGSAPASP